jgi:hypothetical protein
MAKQGTLTVRILSDTKQAEAGLKQFESRVQSTGDKLSSAGQKMTMFASVPIAAAMGVATKAASDLNETLSKSNTVFSSSAKEVEDWAEGAADSFGQSKREALDAASTFGNMFVQLGVGSEQAARMSMQMTELASDFASFHNADITEVINAQSAAFRGEYDALQRFVPTINAAAVEQEALAQTGKKATAELTAQEKALAVQTLMLKGAGDAMGDYDRTADSAANQTRRAKAAMEDASAEIGQALLPLAAKLAGGIGDLAQKFGELPTPIQHGVLALGGLIAAAGPILTVAGNIGKLVEKAKGVDNLSGSLGSLAKNAAAVGVAGFAVGKAIEAWGDEMTGAADAGAYLGDQIVGSFDAATATWGAYIDEMNRLGQAHSDLIDDANNTVDPFKREGYLKAAEAIAVTRREMGATHEAAFKLTENLGITGTEALRLAQNEEAMAAATDKATGGLDAQAAAAEADAQAQQDLADGIKAANDELRRQFDALWGAQDALYKNQDAQRAAEEASIKAMHAQAHLNATIKTYGEDSPEAAAAAFELAEANREMDDANREAARSAIDVTTATSELASALQNGDIKIDAARKQIKAWADQGLITEQQARDMRTELDLVAVTAHNLDGQQSTVRVDADTLPFWLKWLQVQAALGSDKANMPQIGPDGRFVQRHTGGPGHAGYPYLVGRPGAEELFVPTQSGTFLSGPDTDRALSRSGGGGDMTLAVLSTLKSIERKIERTTVSLDGHAVGTMTRREADFHALRNAV